MTRTLRLLIVLALMALSWTAASQAVARTAASGKTNFAVIGDMGNGQTPQYEVARQMLKTHGTHPFEFVLMLGDNLYGTQRPRDFADKFEIPYGPFLRMGIPFYAALGNHDEPDNRNYPKFNMNGQRFYSVVRANARFFFLDTNLLDPAQLKWFETSLRDATEEWKIVIFHHPIYSDGDRHGPNVALRVALEPLLVRYDVDVVFSGHEHIYERIKPQKGIVYFIVGSSGQLRKGGLTPSAITAASFDQDQAFLVASIEGAEMAFQAISRTGLVVDSGVLHERVMTEQ
jgi:3',5'-cyclic AMP phosphodiesterase CpdA